MDWTPLDLKNLAILYDGLADALLAFRKQNSAALSTIEKHQLTIDFGRLISASEGFEQRAVAGALTGVDAAVEDLQSAAHEAIAALQTITNVQKALGIATAAVALAAAATVPTPGSITAALGVLVAGIQSALAPPPAAPANASTAADPAAAKST